MDFYTSLTAEQLVSMGAMDGLPDHAFLSVDDVTQLKSPPCRSCCKCITFHCLIHALNKIFSDDKTKNNWPERKNKIEHVLKNTFLSEEEIQKYVFIDNDVPYTRNLVCTDNKNFTLILMCWNPKKESKIHDHPCDGCFVKTLSGGVKESRYHMEEVQNELGQTEKVMKFDWEYTTTANEVNYMDNYLGYHKIGAATTDKPSMSLHLYTPPFKSCKVSIFLLFLFFF
jgi:cysteine dioxygenase